MTHWRTILSWERDLNLTPNSPKKISPERHEYLRNQDPRAPNPDPIDLSLLKDENGEWIWRRKDRLLHADTEDMYGMVDTSRLEYSAGYNLGYRGSYPRGIPQEEIDMYLQYAGRDAFEKGKIDGAEEYANKLPNRYSSVLSWDLLHYPDNSSYVSKAEFIDRVRPGDIWVTPMASEYSTKELAVYVQNITSLSPESDDDRPFLEVSMNSEGVNMKGGYCHDYEDSKLPVFIEFLKGDISRYRPTHWLSLQKNRNFDISIDERGIRYVTNIGLV